MKATRLVCQNRLAFPTAAAAADRAALLRSVGEECVTDGELLQLVEKKPSFCCYDGFEPSGRMHIAQGIVKAINVNKCIASGGHFVFWVADWFALMNDKAGGSLPNIRTVGAYLLEVWRSSGMNLDHVTFRWSSDEISRNAADYWRTVLDIGRRNTMARIKKCCTIMGRAEGGLTAAQILYPLMQCSDIFFLKADVCQLGMDQRKVNMLAREYCDATRRKLKPIVLSHHMLAGLKEGHAKMSKSDPDSAIFMEDSADDVRRKIASAFCPKVSLRAAEDGGKVNPCLDYARSILFALPEASMAVGEHVFTTYEALEAAFLNDIIGEAELKEALAAEINALLQPVRVHFETSQEAMELLRRVKGILSSTQPATEAPSNPPPRPVLGVWVPHDTALPLAEALLLVKKMVSFLRETPDGSVTLINADWATSATADMSQKEAQTVGEFNVSMLRALGAPVTASVATQDSFMLQQPDAYWYAAINAGRRCRLADLETHELPNAGLVVAVVMRGADVSTLQLTHWVSANNDDISRRAAVILGVPQWGGDLPLPVGALCGAQRAAGPDDLLLVSDSDMDIRRKIKQSFAAEKDTASPIVELATWAIGEGRAIDVKRASQHGGDTTYGDANTLLEDYAAGRLHPADLKAAMTVVLLSLLQPLKDKMAAPEGKAALGVIRNIVKRRRKG